MANAGQTEDLKFVIADLFHETLYGILQYKRLPDGNRATEHDQAVARMIRDEVLEGMHRRGITLESIT